MDKGESNINTRFQTRPTLSPDGKYLFFNKHIPNRKNSSDIYWISTEIIDDIKKEVFNVKNTK
ncbi:hypothetical protein ACE01N_04315 [Saccharicrinis sp. FJH2]|uniref:hypothetical protein n=1 Tax=Saccharicrinis sp. FJH65 TaxID=3344659 RepID=UPI0035F470DC